MGKLVVAGWIAIWLLFISAILMTRAVSSKPHDSELPNKLIVTKPEDKINHLSALSVIISDEVKARNLYKEIIALPTFAPGRYNCPADFSFIYLLDFYFNRLLVSHGLYYPTGCTSVKLDGLNIRQDSKGTFGHDLQKALGLSNTDFIGR